MLEQSSDAVLRMTDEYAAAFDLEVWKAQQKARFRSQLRQAKENLEREIHLAVREKEKENIAELENTRKDLEKVAKRLQEDEKAIQRQTQQLELREAAFEARRVKVAEQHEIHINRTEQRAKRTIEDAFSRQTFLESQVLEKDTMINQLKDKLQSLETEYDSLKEKMDSCLAVQSNSHAESLRRMEQKVTKANKAIDELKSILNDRTYLLQRLWSENEEMQMQLTQSKLNSETLFKKYHDLMNMWYVREHKDKVKEIKRLDDKVQQRRLREESQSKPADDPLYKILYSLKAEVASYLNEVPPTQRESGVTLNRSSTPSFVCVERPLPVTPSTSASPHPPQVVERIPAASYIADGVMAINPLVEKADGDGISGNTSTSSYPHVEVESWRSDDGDEKEKDKENNKKNKEAREIEVGKIRQTYVSTLPPLAPVVSTTMQEVSPSPEDFAEATKTGAPSAESTRNEMMIFVYQLKINRQKLLDTGVYNEDHAVIKEMDEKVALYEQYLAVYT
ncbi:unnamed protein product [Phytomonas sp. Hart1]|nr:unnamed protein product [Phytomonas sp. Hart1]|eukprot:CCW68632.1 unnamed protein product [Phytomonas sp. isolate Hart1]